jgi:copper chaperone
MTEIRVLRVSDMSCGHCEMSVQEALDGLDGVERSKADHTTGRVELSYDASKVSDEKLREVIEEAGYTLRA